MLDSNENPLDSDKNLLDFDENPAGFFKNISYNCQTMKLYVP